MSCQLLTVVARLNAHYQPGPTTCVRLLTALARAKQQGSFQDHNLASECLRLAALAPEGLGVPATRQLLFATSRLGLRGTGHVAYVDKVLECVLEKRDERGMVDKGVSCSGLVAGPSNGRVVTFRVPQGMCCWRWQSTLELHLVSFFVVCR